MKSQMICLDCGTIFPIEKCPSCGRSTTSLTCSTSGVIGVRRSEIISADPSWLHFERGQQQLDLGNDRLVYLRDFLKFCELRIKADQAST